MLRKAISAVIIVAGLTLTSAFADTLVVENVSSAPDNVPPRGIDKAAVTETFGNPDGRTEAVGEPPISSWQYPGYIVYFENDRVLHTVARR